MYKDMKRHRIDNPFPEPTIPENNRNVWPWLYFDIAFIYNIEIEEKKVCICHRKLFKFDHNGNPIKNVSM